MSKNFGDLITAQEIDRYTTQKISTELVKQRPGPKYAIVKAIDAEAGIADVSYVGEDSVVKVPFGVAAPTEIGQEVRIEGVPGDRFITSVRGTTAVEKGIEDNATQIEVSKADITDALLGQYEGEDSILQQLMGWASNIGKDVSFDALFAALQGKYAGENPVLQGIQEISKPLRIIFDPAGLIPDWLLPGISIGKLTDSSVNLIVDGAFELPPDPGLPEGSWFWSNTGGRGDSGSAAFLGKGEAEEILSKPIPRSGDLTFLSYIRSEGLYAPGTGDVIIATGYAYDGANNLVGSKVLASGIPNDDAWTEFSSKWEPPSSAATIVIGIKATEVLQGGTVFIDDVRLSRPQSIPQAWVQNLLSDLQNMFGWLESLVDSLLGSFGIPSLGDIFDKIMDLADEVADFFGLGLDTQSGLSNLIDGLISNPIEWIGQLPQHMISGLTSALNNANQFIQNVINAIIQGIRRVPVVGGTISNVIEALTGLSDKADTTEEHVVIVQTQVTAVQEVFSVTSTKPLWTGLDPTADVSFPLALLSQPMPHAHSYGEGTFPSTKQTGFSGISEYEINGNFYIGACIRISEAGVKDQLTLMARRVGNVGYFNAAVLLMRPDGSFTLVASSEDMSGDLTTSTSWIQVKTNEFIVEPGDTALILLNCSMGNTVYVMGAQMITPSASTGFRPRRIGFNIAYNGLDNMDGYPYISTITADSSYSQSTPYIELGKDIGQTAARSFFDNFNRDSMGNNWLLGRYDAVNHTSGGSNLSISGNSVQNPSWQLTTQRAWGMYTVPLATDRIACEVDIVSNKSVNCGIVICANSRQGNYVALGVDKDACAIATVNDIIGNGSVVRGTANTGGAGRWQLSYDINDNTFRVAKNGVVLIQWTDTGNVVRHGKGERFCGMYIDHSGFSSASNLDNWHAYDIVDQE